MKADQIIRAAIPDANDSLCEHILWGRTPYPMGRITARSLYRAADRFRRAQENGVQLCSFCDNAADGMACRKCDAVLSGRKAA